MQDSEERLNKYLALRLGISRREADELIEQGKVTINQEIARLGARITAETTVEVNGTPVDTSVRHETLLFHKPVGYVCSRKAQGDNPTIYDLIPKQYHNLKPVGRLDKNSSGILLLTNDGDFAHRMTHPSFRKVKIYEVQLDKPLQPLHQQMISDHGVMLEDGKSQFVVVRVEDTSDSANAAYQITMTEGRNRQIRRTFASLGYEVIKLHRTQFGSYPLGGLAVGQCSPLTAKA